MSTSSAVTPAHALLSLLTPTPGQPAPADATVDTAVATLLAEIAALDDQHNRRKTLSQDQLAEQVFRSSPTFKDERALTPYLRYQLRVARNELSALVGEMRGRNNGVVTATEIATFRDVLIDYMFDLRDILAFIQRNVSGWSFFQGDKNRTVTSWEVYQLARGLAYHSTYMGTGAYLDHKAAQIASMFVLRQAMELRFERLVAVYPTDPKGKAPRLKHGYHQEFIAANPQFFCADGFEIKKLRHLYDWCSEIVHQAYQPYAWQVSMALRRGGDLLRSRSAPADQAWSIFNAVRIDNVESMQAAFEEHFLATYGHGTWRFIRGRPEGLVPTWRPEMALTSDDYRPVLRASNRTV